MKVLDLNLNEDLNYWGIKRAPGVKTLVFGDEAIDYDVYLIPIDLLVYNQSNGRMFMEAKKFESEQEKSLSELRKEDIETYNNEIETIIWGTDSDRNDITKIDIKNHGQIEAGVVLDDGTVIDGNRRFTCIRRLHRDFPEDEKYMYFKAALVRVDGKKITREILKKYELQVQFGLDDRVAYNTINMNMSIYELIEKTPDSKFDYSTVASLIRKSEGDIVKICNTCKLIDDFLEYIDKPEEYPIAEEMKIYWPLEPFAMYLKKNEKSLTPIQVEERKSLFFDYLLSLKVELITQNLRDKLIKKVFPKPEETTKLATIHNEIIGEKISQVISNSETSEEFINSVELLKKTPEAQKDTEEYNRIVEKLSTDSQLDIPVKECKRALDALTSVEVGPLVKSDKELAKSKLIEVSDLLNDIKKRLSQIDIELNNEL